MKISEANNWIDYDLSDLIVLIESGKRPYGGATEETGEIPSLGGENIRQGGGLELSVIKKIPTDYFRAMTKGVLQNEDVLINKDGANTGKIGIYEGQFPVATINEHLFLLRAAPGRLTQRFLYRILSSEKGQRTVHAKISGSAQPGLKADFIYYFPIRVPRSTAEQNRITVVLNAIDQTIEKTEAVIGKLKQVRAGLLHDLLTRGLDEHGQLRDPIAHPEQFQDSKLGKIPREWKTEKLARLTLSIVDGVHHTPKYVDHGIPFLTAENLTKGTGISLSPCRYVSKQSHDEYRRRAEVRPGDVLVSKDGTLGVARVVPDRFPDVSIFVSVALLRPKREDILAALVREFFETGWFIHQLGQLSAGTGLKHIHLEHFREFLLPVPSMNEQREIVAVIAELDRVMAYEMEEFEKLLMIKSGLMNDLLTGSIRVPETIAEVVP